MLDGELSHKGLLYKDSEYYVIRQFMPYVLRESNSYLTETSDGWAVIDVGVDLPSTRNIWEMVVKEVGISFKAIRGIYVTHCHPDHHGASAWLQSVTGAPVYFLDEEIRRARKFVFLGEDPETNYIKTVEPETSRQGFPREFLSELAKDWCQEVGPLYTEPSEITPLYPEQEIELAGEVFQVIPAPGHADGQYALWSPRKKHLFSTDIVTDTYLHFTDWPNTNMENPLSSTIALIDRLLSLGDMKAFPGHGRSFHNMGERLRKLKGLHERRMEKVLQSVRGPVSAGELYTQNLELHPYVHLHRLALGETLGYLNELADRGLLKREETDLLRFSPV